MSVLALPIDTARLRLRDFTDGDLGAILAYASDDEVTRFMFYGPRDESDTRAYLRNMLVSQKATPRTTWELAIERRSDGQLVGACDLTIETEGEGDLGYILARPAWGSGIATEAARAMVEVGFAQLDLHRIYATCDVANTASARVLEKAGLRHRAVLHRHKEAKGRWWDMHLYELRREEWSAP
jgi:[ribosomal protein S5]-alanine N-acetyltransferase